MMPGIAHRGVAKSAKVGGRLPPLRGAVESAKTGGRLPPIRGKRFVRHRDMRRIKKNENKKVLE